MARNNSKKDKAHFARLVELGCIVCKLHLGVYSPPEIHHIRAGCGIGQRSDNSRAIPLCHAHHRTGGYSVAIHAGRKSWEEKFGTEAELLNQVLQELGEISA
ncbi:Ref family recombination enhancement nuclease [Raoultella ornithinolytica]|uniref:Ref family recombination enhancement nuclease n=1 Tax=Raoultella ornithinolytica TaxID=54291 RepID=UPI003917A38B